MSEAEDLRARAHQCRSIARSVDVKDTKKALQDIADDCDAKADRLDMRPRPLR